MSGDNNSNKKDSKVRKDDDDEDTYHEPIIPMVPNFKIADNAFLLSLPTTTDEEREQLVQLIVKDIEKDQMAPFYKHLSQVKKYFNFDQSVYDNLVSQNETEIAKLKENIKNLEENDEGAMELANGWFELGTYYTRIGDFENAEKILLTDAMDVAISLGAKIDLLFMFVRLAFFYDNQLIVKEKLVEIGNLIEKGGDWERRNRYKTYLGIHCLTIRDFKKSAELLVDSLATFTSTELTSYENIAMYATVAGLYSLDRIDLKNKIIDSPELLSIMNSTPALQSITSLTIALYTSDYASFFPFLIETFEKVMIPSRFLNYHANFFIREMRRKVYAQLLDSYKTLSLQSMANSFGVSVEFLDNDLNKFIPNKKLNCVVDRVNGIVVTNRSDNKNAQYQLLIKNGDGLLTKLQKYSAAVKLTGTDHTV